MAATGAGGGLGLPGAGGGPVGDPREDFRTKRHEFILHYYDMAVSDLERHLGIGWQSIVIVAGALAALSLAEQAQLPVPIAVAGAIALGFWGIGNIIDANYWAVRAIGFLANVEAVYFVEEDRTCFNPYMGRHPPNKLMDSLRHQFYAVTAFILIAIVYYVSKIVTGAGQPDTWPVALRTMAWHDLSVWALPIMMFSVYLWFTTKAELKRTRDYRHFVNDCPGPGIVKSRADVRTVDFFPALPPGAVLPGREVQSWLLNNLTRSERRLKLIEAIALGIAVAVVLSFLLFLGTRSFENPLAVSIGVGFCISLVRRRST